MSTSDLHDRLLAAAGKLTYRKLAEMTQSHPETVRRYMQGQAPSADFLSRFCAALGINGNWLLTGYGPMRIEEVQSHALREAAPTDLMGAISKQLATLIERVERLEIYTQGLDTRLRAIGTLHATTEDGDERGGRGGTNRRATRAAVVEGLQRAIAERTPPPAD